MTATFQCYDSPLKLVMIMQPNQTATQRIVINICRFIKSANKTLFNIYVVLTMKQHTLCENITSMYAFFK